MSGITIGAGIGSRPSRYFSGGGGPVYTPVSQDSFTGSNGTAITAHAPNLGPAWLESTGGTTGFTIQSNQMSRADGIIRHAYMDVGATNVKLSVNVTHIENLIGLVVRRSDNLHYWEVFFDYGNQAWQMSLVNGGADVFKGPLLAGTTGLVTLEANGDSVTATGPSGEFHTEVDSSLGSNTQVGIIVTGFAGVASTVDNWLVETIS